MVSERVGLVNRIGAVLATLDIEVRIVLETDDKQMIYMHWKGFRHGPRDVIDRLNRGETVDPSSYYFRTTPYFETSSEKYSWLNRICSVATGSRVGDRRASRSIKSCSRCSVLVLPLALGTTRPIDAPRSVDRKTDVRWNVFSACIG